MNIYTLIFYSAIVLHIITLVYYLIVSVVSVTGILSKYQKLNHINFYIISFIILLQLIYSFGCPLTDWQNYAAERLGVPTIHSFVVEIFKKIGIHISAVSILITFIVLNAAIVLSHFYYKFRK